MAASQTRAGASKPMYDPTLLASPSPYLPPPRAPDPCRCVCQDRDTTSSFPYDTTTFPLRLRFAAQCIRRSDGHGPWPCPRRLRDPSNICLVNRPWSQTRYPYTWPQAGGTLRPGAPLPRLDHALPATPGTPTTTPLLLCMYRVQVRLSGGTNRRPMGNQTPQNTSYRLPTAPSTAAAFFPPLRPWLAGTDRTAEQWAHGLPLLGGGALRVWCGGDDDRVGPEGSVLPRRRGRHLRAETADPTPRLLEEAAAAGVEVTQGPEKEKDQDKEKTRGLVLCSGTRMVGEAMGVVDQVR